MRPPAAPRDSQPALFKDHPLRIKPINQHICLCQELRDLLKGKRSVFLEMTLCFIASCAAIKHLLARQLSHLFFFSCSRLPHRSDCLKVLFTNLRLPRGQAWIRNSPVQEVFKTPQDGRQSAAVHFTGAASLSVWEAESSSPGSSQLHTAFCCSGLSAGHIWLR